VARGRAIIPATFSKHFSKHFSIVFHIINSKKTWCLGGTGASHHPGQQAPHRAGAHHCGAQLPGQGQCQFWQQRCQQLHRGGNPYPLPCIHFIIPSLTGCLASCDHFGFREWLEQVIQMLYIGPQEQSFLKLASGYIAVSPNAYLSSAMPEP